MFESSPYGSTHRTAPTAQSLLRDRGLLGLRREMKIIGPYRLTEARILSFFAGQAHIAPWASRTAREVGDVKYAPPSQRVSQRSLPLNAVTKPINGLLVTKRRRNEKLVGSAHGPLVLADIFTCRYVWFAMPCMYFQ